MTRFKRSQGQDKLINEPPPIARVTDKRPGESELDYDKRMAVRFGNTSWAIVYLADVLREAFIHPNPLDELATPTPGTLET